MTGCVKGDHLEDIGLAVMSNYRAVVAAGSYYLAVSPSLVIPANCSGIVRHLVEVRVLHRFRDTAMVAERLVPRDTAGSCYHIVEPAVDLIAKVHLSPVCRVVPAEVEGIGHNHNNSILVVDLVVVEFAAEEEVDSYCSAAGDYCL